MSRRTIVVDIETTGLDVSRAAVLEVAALDLESGKLLTFVPFLEPSSLAAADPSALAVNRYFERRVFEKQLDQKATAEAYYELTQMLNRNTLAGANPRFDAAALSRAFVAADFGLNPEPWHYRLADLSAYTAGALGIPPNEVPGLTECCSILGVSIPEEHAHTALGDALATAECFRALSLTADARSSVSWPSISRS